MSAPHFIFWVLLIFSRGNDPQEYLPLPVTILSDSTADSSYRKIGRLLPFRNEVDDDKSDYYRTTVPLFSEYWLNDELFVYDDFTYEQLPDQISIDLLAEGSRFSSTWYGKLNSPFGERWGKPHRGIDLRLRTGDSVVSAFDGIVRYARFNRGGYGNCIVIRHWNGLETLYGHLSRIDVEENQYVQSGEMIGRGGSSGHSDGPHLHFETRYKDFAFDPLLCLDPENSRVTVPHLLLGKKGLNKVRYAEEELKAMRESKKYRKGSKSRSISRHTSPHKYHRVAKGESVHSIAKRYGISRTQISKLNGISKYEKLRPGKKLRIR